MAPLVVLLLISSGLILSEGKDLFTDELVQPINYEEGSGLIDHTDHTIDAEDPVGTPENNSRSHLDELKRNLGSAMRLRSKKNLGAAMKWRNKKNMGAAMKWRNKKNMGAAMKWRNKKNMGAAMKWRNKKNMGAAMKWRSKKNMGAAMKWRSKKNMGSAMRLRLKKNLASAMRLRTRRHIGMQWRWPQISSRLMRRSFSADYPEFYWPPSGLSDGDHDEAVEQAVERRLSRQLPKRNLGAVMRFRSLAGSGFYPIGKPRQWEYED